MVKELERETFVLMIYVLRFILFQRHLTPPASPGVKLLERFGSCPQRAMYTARGEIMNADDEEEDEKDRRELEN